MDNLTRLVLELAASVRSTSKVTEAFISAHDAAVKEAISTGRLKPTSRLVANNPNLQQVAKNSQTCEFKLEYTKTKPQSARNAAAIELRFAVETLKECTAKELPDQIEAVVTAAIEANNLSARLEAEFDAIAAAVGWTQERYYQTGESPCDVATEVAARTFEGWAYEKSPNGLGPWMPVLSRAELAQSQRAGTFVYRNIRKVYS